MGLNAKRATEDGVLRLRRLRLMLSKRSLLSATVLVASFSASFSSVCFAQSDIQPRWTDSTTTKVKPEMRRKFQGYLKQLMAAYEKAGTPWFLTLENFA